MSAQRTGGCTLAEQSHRLLRAWHALATLAILGCSAFKAGAAAPNFTPEEQAWISQNPVVHYVGANNISPLESVENGEYRGLISAYLGIVSKKTGITFKLVPTDSWQQAQQAIREGRALLIPNATEDVLDEDLAKRLNYTQPYFASPVILVTRSDSPVTFDPDTMRGKKIAVRAEQRIQARVRANFPESITVKTATPEDNLQAIIGGAADAAIGTEATLQPLLRRQYERQLGVASMVPMQPYEARMAVRKDMPLLYSIIDKSLGSITAHESDVVYERYLSQADYGAPTAWSILHYRRNELALATAGVLLLIFLAWRAHASGKAAKRSERDKSRFLATMSHEIRTPINAMLGSIEMLGRTTLDSRQAGFTQVAADSAEALIDLLDNVLDLSKLDAAQLTLEKLPTDLEKLGDQVVRLARVKADQKRLPINLRVQQPQGMNVLVDATRLRQVLNNLLGNAVKFTERGCVNLDLAVLSDAIRQGYTLTGRITDTGVGIPAEHQQALFKPYHQADNSTTRMFGGTGLGLAICKELVELMGGKIALSSQVGSGTSISFEIPVELLAAVIESGSSHPPARSGEDNIAQGHVLVVEDHPANQRLIAEQLKELGVRSTLAASGAEAIEQVAHGMFDLVLMDCHMPGMDGYETTERIRAVEPREQHLPIVAISASTGSDHLEKCVRAGMDGVLRKPLRLEELRSTLELWPVQMVQPSSSTADAASTDDYADHQRHDVQALVAACWNNRLDEIEHFAHRMRGAALMHADLTVAGLAQTIEVSAQSKVVPNKAVLSALEEALETALRARAATKE